MTPIRYGIVGRGWRADFYLRLAREMPERFEVAGAVTRSEASGEVIERGWGIPTYRDVASLVGGQQPDFVITSVPRVANPAILEQLVGLGMPVLSETPPAGTVRELRSLWSQVGNSGLVQVAEQYQFQPLHAVRVDLAGSGALGRVTSVLMSSTHDYHAVSLMRRLLRPGFAPATISAQKFTAPMMRTRNREGWPVEEELIEADEVIATLDFGDSRIALYDFTQYQYFHPLLGHRHVVRGTHGEIIDDQVVRMADVRTPVRSRIERRQAGIEGNLEGFALDTLSLDGEVCWRNPYFPVRLSDEEIAVATCLDRMSAWLTSGEEPPYPLAEACQDTLIALAVDEAWQSGRPVTTAQEPWAV